MDIAAGQNEDALLRLSATTTQAKGIILSDGTTNSWRMAQEANSPDLVIGDGSFGNSVRLRKQNQNSNARFVVGEEDVVISGGFENIKMTCSGTGIFKELGVLPGANWSDYVFDTNYNLMPLDSVSNYIRKNHHLPEIPSAKEVKENGIKVAEMNALLLKKIEELTLHLIALKKEVDQLKGNK